jgi:hypothetical protein
VGQGCGVSGHALRWGCIELLVAVERDKLFALSLIYMPRYINDGCVIRGKDGRGNTTRMEGSLLPNCINLGVTCSIEQGSGKGGRNNASQASSRPKIVLQMLLLTRPDRTGEQRASNAETERQCYHL